MALKSICGVILISDDPEKLAEFYGKGLDIKFEREDHGDLQIHYGVDIAEIHFAIHPPSNFQGLQTGTGSRVAIAFDVDSLSEHAEKLEKLGAQMLREPHDEGFGPTSSFLDPEGNVVELVELEL